MENKNYIYLDGRNATLTDNNYLTWQIPEHYYKNVPESEDLYLSLEHCQFHGTLTLKTLNMPNAEIIADTRIINGVSTYAGNENVIGFYDCFTDTVDTGADPVVPVPIVQGIRENHLKDCRFKIQRFNTITLSVRMQGSLVNFTTNANGISQDYCKFLIKLTNIKDNNQIAFKNGAIYTGNEMQAKKFF